MNKFIKLIITVAVFALPFFTHAQPYNPEKIISYHSDIQIIQDSTMLVQEYVTVHSNGEEIKHGIYRDFPIAYKDKNGERKLVDFELIGVLRNQSPEKFHTERAGNGVRIYAGDANVELTPGDYQYLFTYKTGKQLGFFDDHDELYWNVTGNDWAFDIESATATVRLPAKVPKDKITATLYTGPQGSTRQDGTSTVSDGQVEFVARNLSAGEGLTVVVGWPKGIVAQPTSTQNFVSSLYDNLDYIVGIVGVLFVLIFYLYVWNKRGRDPKGGTVVAQYESPMNLSPAMVRYILRMGNDSKGFASALISMGVKGAVKIMEDKGFFGKKTYTITKSTTVQNLFPEEKVLHDGLFDDGDSMILNTSNSKAISLVKDDFNHNLKTQAGKKYFIKNSFALVLGIVMSVAVIFIAIFISANILFGISSLLSVLFWPALFISLLIINIVFGRLMRAYTQDGKKLLDEINGFKWFLSVTEKDRLAFHNPPEQTPQLFEKMLPYALALGVEHEWAQQFAKVFANLEQQGIHYAPIWYVGSLANFSADSFASDMGKSFAGAVASSSTPPGSNSGFSGGSSGGGGGGGGGGGW